MRLHLSLERWRCRDRPKDSKRDDVDEAESATTLFDLIEAILELLQRRQVKYSCLMSSISTVLKGLKPSLLVFNLALSYQIAKTHIQFSLAFE